MSDEDSSVTSYSYLRDTVPMLYASLDSSTPTSGAPSTGATTAASTTQQSHQTSRRMLNPNATSSMSLSADDLEQQHDLEHNGHYNNHHTKHDSATIPTLTHNASQSAAFGNGSNYPRLTQDESQYNNDNTNALLSAAESMSRQNANNNKDSPSNSNSNSNSNGVFIQYPIRWLILTIFSLLTITNAIIWISFAPIQELSAEYYSVSKTAINYFSISFMILFLPGYILAFYVMEKYGLRNGLIFGAVLQTIGAWIKYFSIYGPKAGNNHADSDIGFAVGMVGQCIAGIAQPMFTNAPAKLSADWFSMSQRNLATTIAAMSNPIGIALGQLLPTLLVDKGGGIPLLLLLSACISIATAILTIIFIKKEPLTAPSRSTMERRQRKEMEKEVLKQQREQQQQQQQQQQGASSSSSSPPIQLQSWYTPLLTELRLLLSNRDFLILTFGVGMGLGLFNAITTLIEQLISPCGYTKDDAGNFGALLIGFGLIGAGIIGPIMDHTHAYNRILKLGLISAFGGTVFMFLSLRPDSYVLVAISFGVLGALILPLLPVCMECAAECTYPASEDASSGILLTSGNIVGVIMIVVVDKIIEDPYKTVWNPACITFLCFLGVAVLVVGLFYNGQTRRQDAEKVNQATQQASVPLNEETTVTQMPISQSQQEQFNNGTRTVMIEDY